MTEKDLKPGNFYMLVEELIGYKKGTILKYRYKLEDTDNPFPFIFDNVISAFHLPGSSPLNKVEIEKYLIPINKKEKQFYILLYGGKLSV